MTKSVSRLTAQDLVTALAGPGVESLPEILGRVVVRSAVIDSRLVTPGCLFIALRGEHRSGHEFIPPAVENGALAGITEAAPDLGTCATLDLTAGRLAPGAVSEEPPFCLIVADSLAALQQVAAHWRRQHDVRVVGITGSIGKTTSKEALHWHHL